MYRNLCCDNLILLPKFHCLISVILRLLGSAEGVLFINVNNDIGLFFKKKKKSPEKQIMNLMCALLQVSMKN